MLPIGTGITRRSIAAGIRGDRVDPVTRRLLSVPGLSYYLDCGRSELHARQGLGDVRVGFMAARNSSAPGVHIAPDGQLIPETRSDVPLTVAGYWDATGFHRFHRPGWWVGTAATNYVKNSIFSLDTGSDGLADYWNSSLGTSTLSACPMSGGKCQRNAHTFVAEPAQYVAGLTQGSANDTFDVSSGSIAITLSFWARGDMTGLITGADNISNRWVHIEGRQNDNTYTETAVSRKFSESVTDGLSATEWRKFVFTATLTNTATRKLSVRFVFMGAVDGSRAAAGESYWLEVTGVQIEKSPYATLHVPTTTAALTRPKDVCITWNGANRNAAEETVLVVYTPWWGTGIAQNKWLMQSSVVARRLYHKFYSAIVAYPNYTDSPDCAADASGLSWSAYQTIVAAATCRHASPYAELYFNKTKVGEDTSDDFTNTEWGDFTYLGSDSGGAQLNGVIHAVVVFNRALSAAEVAYVTNLLNGAA